MENGCRPLLYRLTIVSGGTKNKAILTREKEEQELIVRWRRGVIALLKGQTDRFWLAGITNK